MTDGKIHLPLTKKLDDHQGNGVSYYTSNAMRSPPALVENFKNGTVAALG